MCCGVCFPLWWLVHSILCCCLGPFESETSRPWSAAAAAGEYYEEEEDDQSDNDEGEHLPPPPPPSSSRHLRRSSLGAQSLRQPRSVPSLSIMGAIRYNVAAYIRATLFVATGVSFFFMLAGVSLIMAKSTVHPSAAASLGATVNSTYLAWASSIFDAWDAQLKAYEVLQNSAPPLSWTSWLATVLSVGFLRTALGAINLLFKTIDVLPLGTAVVWYIIESMTQLSDTIIFKLPHYVFLTAIAMVVGTVTQILTASGLVERLGLPPSSEKIVATLLVVGGVWYILLVHTIMTYRRSRSI